MNQLWGKAVFPLFHFKIPAARVVANPVVDVTTIYERIKNGLFILTDFMGAKILVIVP